MRKPGTWVALAVVAGYAALTVLASSVSGVPYTALGDSADTLFRGVLVTMVVLAVGLAALTSWQGWWWSVLRDDLPPAPRWLWAVPALVVIAIALALGLVILDWGSRSPLYAAVALLTCLLVGFNEELLLRGILVVGLRASLVEWQVFLGSSLLFGLLHGINFFSGQGLGPTAYQMVSATAFGAVMYTVRRVSGTLVLCMALHGLWDAMAFLSPIGGLLLEPLQFVALIVCIVGIFAGRGLFSGTGPPAARVR